VCGCGAEAQVRDEVTAVHALNVQRVGGGGGCGARRCSDVLLFPLCFSPALFFVLCVDGFVWLLIDYRKRHAQDLLTEFWVLSCMICVIGPMPFFSFFLLFGL